MTTAPDLITSAEAASLLGINRNTLTRWVREGRITPAFRAPGLRGAMAFHRTTIDALVQTGAGAREAAAS